MDTSNYFKKETLTIDPLQLIWGTYYGGTRGSWGESITTDSPLPQASRL